MGSKGIRYLRMEFSPAEHRQVRLAAAIGDESMTAFARRAVVAAARAGAQQAYLTAADDGQSEDPQADGRRVIAVANADRSVT